MARIQSPSNTEFDERGQYHNKTHKITLRDGTIFYGLISRVDYQNREFYLLDNNHPGMLGAPTAGRKFSWDECQSVRAENQRVGAFDDDMIREWERWDRQSGVK